MSIETNDATPYQPQSHAYPEGVDRGRYYWPYLVVFLLYHGGALFAFVPWLFDWGSVIACLAGIYIFGVLGINVCYHRLLTHRSFACARRVEHLLALLGVCCLQETPARWVAIHRMHHQHSDEPNDPHSPLIGFLWGHFGWLIRANRDLERVSLFERYARDLLSDRFYRRLEHNYLWLWLNLALWLGYFSAGLAIGYYAEGWERGLQLGLSLLVWGVIVRTVMVWHMTWSVNSVTHLWGYRNYETGDNSRNNFAVGLISHGEGWHNNHHAQPRCAAHGHRWWELDVTWIIIWLMKQVRLAWDIVPINEKMASQQAVRQ